MASVTEDNLLSMQSEWSDVTPIPQTEGVEPVLQILYDSEYSDAMGLLRALMLKGEISKRALYLTTYIIYINSAHYTVWEYRRCILDKLKLKLENEVDFMNQIHMINTKNYQLWNHRRFIMQRLGVSHLYEELKFLEEVFKKDAKHYHAWAHRQWLVDKYNLWEGELEFTSTVIEEDVMNNSAWNHRFNVFMHFAGSEDDDERWQKEVVNTIDIIGKYPDNESPWSYLKGILCDCPKSYSIKSSSFQTVLEIIWKLCKVHEQDTLFCPAFEANLSFDLAITLSGGESKDLLERAKTRYTFLIKVDKRRQSLWQFKLDSCLHHKP